MIAVFRIVILVFLFGCASSSDELNKRPGQAINSPWERNEILDHIRFLEDSHGRKGCSLEVVKVEDRGKELEGFVEYWTVKSCGVKTVYKVRIAPMGRGQARYSVSYPLPADLLRGNN